MLRSECDKIYKGRCSCLGKNATTKLENEPHWCESQTHEALVIDTYHLPPGKTRFYGQKSVGITEISHDFFKQIANDKKVLISAETKPILNSAYKTQIRITMKWFKEADFLPTWIWMIESGWNKSRDEWNKIHDIGFVKQVITKNYRFIVSEGPYTTKTEYLPYHVPFDQMEYSIQPTISL
jgi:hypothetical protein